MNNLDGKESSNRKPDHVETFESLWEYCTLNKRCIPSDWHGLWQMLRNKRQLPSGGWEPPVPLILSAAYHTIPLQKHLRFREHIQWACDQGQAEQIGAYLRSLPENKWLHFGEV